MARRRAATKALPGAHACAAQDVCSRLRAAGGLHALQRSGPCCETPAPRALAKAVRLQRRPGAAAPGVPERGTQHGLGLTPYVPSQACDLVNSLQGVNTNAQALRAALKTSSNSSLERCRLILLRGQPAAHSSRAWAEALPALETDSCRQFRPAGRPLSGLKLLATSKPHSTLIQLLSIL
jgi:hypothetical protein